MKESEMTHEDKMEFYAKTTMNKTKDMSDWATFFGVVKILEIIGGLFVGYLFFR